MPHADAGMGHFCQKHQPMCMNAYSRIFAHICENRNWLICANIFFQTQGFSILRPEKVYSHVCVCKSIKLKWYEEREFLPT